MSCQMHFFNKYLEKYVIFDTYFFILVIAIYCAIPYELYLPLEIACPYIHYCRDAINRSQRVLLGLVTGLPDGHL